MTGRDEGGGGDCGGVGDLGGAGRGCCNIGGGDGGGSELGSSGMLTSAGNRSTAPSGMSHAGGRCFRGLPCLSTG